MQVSAAAAHGAYAGLLGRGRPEHDPGIRVEQLTAESAAELAGTPQQNRLDRPMPDPTTRPRWTSIPTPAAATASLAANAVLPRWRYGATYFPRGSAF